MGKIRLSLLVPVLATIFVGCASNTKQLGCVGDTTFYRVKASSFAGPNFSALVSKDSDGCAHVEQVFGGPGLGATVISAVGQVGSSAVLGLSFPKYRKNVGDNVNVSGGNSNGGSSSADSSSSSSSNATGGNGNSSATGGNGNGGSSTGGTANGGGQFVPPGHINNPGGNPHNP